MKTQLMTFFLNPSKAFKSSRFSFATTLVTGLVLFGFSMSEGYAAAGNSGAKDVAVRPIPDPDNIGSDADEGIGTLPIVIGEDDYSISALADLLPVGLLSVNGLPLPYTHIVGSRADLDAAVIATSGAGVITILPTGEGDGRFHIGFHGNVKLRLSLIELRLRGLEPMISTGAEFDGGMASVCSANGCANNVPLAVGNGSLSFSSLISGTALMQTAVQFVAVSVNQHSVMIDFSLTNDFALNLVQRVN